MCLLTDEQNVPGLVHVRKSYTRVSWANVDEDGQKKKSMAQNLWVSWNILTSADMQLRNMLLTLRPVPAQAMPSAIAAPYLTWGL
jgi:hypothetical protein